MAIIIFLILLLFLDLPARLGASGRDEDCEPTRCYGGVGPVIRYPFRLKDRQPDLCGYPGFDLSCEDDQNHTATILELPFSVKVAVREIDYITQSIHTYDPHHHCFPRLLQNLNLSSTSPFQLATDRYSYYTINEYSLFSCSSSSLTTLNSYYNHLINCLSDPPNHKVFAVSSGSSMYRYPVLSCKKKYKISSPVPDEIFYEPYELILKWSKPTCGICESESKYCRLKNNSREHETECVDSTPKSPTTDVLRGLFLLVVVIIAMYFVFRLIIIKREDQAKIEKFLEDYTAFKPARYSYADIKKLTSKFKEKIGEGGYGIVYKGKLSNDVHVAIKILNNVKGNGDEFINEVGTMGTIHHINVVRLVGYCADGYKRALVYEFLPNHSLEKIISSEHKKHSLGWEKLQGIALGIAKGIEYLHQGCDQRIVHFDIKPHNILLDHKFDPKISDFGLAKLCSKEQSVVSMTAARGTVGYIAPEVFSRNFGNVSCKSDVYSFGMLLLEMVGVRNNIVTQNTSEVYFPEWIYKCLDHGEELGIQIEEDGDAMIVRS